MMLLMSREKAESLGHKPLATMKSYAFAGLEPERMGLGPAYATPIALKRAGLNLKDIGLVELNEAFAAQVIACERAMDSDEFCKEKLGLSQKMGAINPEILNVNGGAIAMGHPLGCTGAKLSTQMFNELRRRKKKYGIVTACVGGGQGIAGVWELLN